MTRFAIVAVVRNQAPYLLEWMAHHLAVGIDDFVLCVHGSSDGTARITRRLTAMGYARHHKLQVQADDPLASACKQVAGFREVTSADWVCVLDIDQFINIHAGYGKLPDLLAHVPEGTDYVSLMQDHFGSNGVDQMTDLRVTTQFTAKAAPDKGTHQPVLFRPSALKDPPDNPFLLDRDVAQINAYTCKSRDNLAVHLATPLLATPPQIATLWTAHDLNETEDPTIRRYDMWFGKYHHYLKSDRRLRLARRDGLNWHLDRARSTREDPKLSGLIPQT